MKLANLKVCNVESPMGYAMEAPVFSWTVEDAVGKQDWAAVHIECDGKTVFDSGLVPEADSLGWQVDVPLTSRKRYHYRLTVCSKQGEMASASDWFETGKRNEPWAGEWISPVKSRDSAIVRKTFHVTELDGEGRLYLCGLGVYEAYINGKRVGSEFLAPGYHSYDFHLGAQTYDVGSMLHEGENELTIWLGEGWFKGRLGFEGGYTDLYGDRFYAIAELYAGGTLVAKTDSSWEELSSPILFANIYDGEIFDARVQPEPVGMAELAVPGGCGALCDRVSLPVRSQESFPAKAIRTPKGDLVLDFGQNLTGWVVFQNHLPRDGKITLTAGEILQDEEFYHDNYRTAKSEFTYISNGETALVRPHFTFFGFRYMKVDCDFPVDADDFTAIHLRSDMPQTGFFTCGNEKVNQLYRNAVWGMKDNFLDVPTDCPQRDERLGWTGDAQAISETACQALYMPGFYRKYLWDMRAEQSILDGSVPNVVPRIKQGMIGEHGSCPWADAGVIIPWNTWRYFGNESLLRETYPGMKAWVDCQRRKEEAIGGAHLVKDGFHFADWLAQDNPQPGPFGATDPLYIASAYYYRCAQIVAETAGILDLPEQQEYAALSRAILADIQGKYFDEKGLCLIQTQTAAALAIVFGLTEAVQEQGKVLRALVEARGNHLSTGFVGTPILCPALTMTGNGDTAVTVLLQEDYPSWLYSVNLGATTIWERWNSVEPDGHMNPEGMNSLNHYTYGSIAGWMIGYLCGLRPVKPGYRQAIIQPSPDKRLGRARAELRTAAGTFVSQWQVEGDGFAYEMTIPFGATAELRLPGREVQILEAGTYRF